MQYPPQLKKIQSLELKIAKEIKRVCEKNDIKYFIMWGSMLGAVRHGGFIPWDDDMDFGMLREDYDRFLRACETDLDDRFFLQTWDTDPECPIAYAKIRLLNTHFVEKRQEKSKMNNGIFVDIFPYDNVPKSNFLKRINDLKYFACERLLWIKKDLSNGNIKTDTLAEKAKHALLSAACLPFPYDWVKERFRHLQIRHNSEDADKIIGPKLFRPYSKDAFPKRWTRQLDVIKFEGVEFPVFKEKEEFLTYFYGDYMTPPPEEKRNGHNFVSVDFGPY